MNRAEEFPPSQCMGLFTPIWWTAFLHPRHRVRNFRNFSRDILRRKNKIDAPACYCAFGHIGLLRCVELLRNGNAPHFLYAAKRRGSVTIISRDNDSDKFTAPVLG